MALRILCIGECMIELKHRDAASLDLAYGGDTLNTAVYLARTVPREKITVDYMTVLGNDPYSEAMLAEWQAEGIGTQMIGRIPDALPGLYIIRTDERGERRFFHYRSASAARQLFQEDKTRRLLASLSSYDCIYFSAITLSILSTQARTAFATALDAARSPTCRIAFDTNYRPAGWPDRATAQSVITDFLAHVDIVLPTDEDDKALFGDADIGATVARYRAAGVKEIVVKLGAAGCLLASKTEETTVPVPHPISPIDTTAAGDAFNAGYLGTRLIGALPAAAALAGHRLAGIVIQHRGAIIPRPAMPGSAQ